MKKTIFLSILSLIGFISFAQAPSIEWQKSLGGTNEESAKSIKQTADGGYIIVGSSKSNDNDVSGNHLNANLETTWDGWVVKLNAQGAIEWQKSLGGSGVDKFNSVDQNTDGTFIVVGTSNSVDGDVTGSSWEGWTWIVKLDKNGNLLWNRTLTSKFLSVYECCGNFGNDIEITSDGGIVVAIEANYLATNGLSYGDGLVVKLDVSGNLQWRTPLIYEYHDSMSAIEQTSDGSYVVAGYTTHNYFTKERTDHDFWVVKLSSTGSVIWDKIYGGSKYDSAFDIKQTNDGGYIVVGATTSNDGNVIGNHYSEGQSGYLADYWVIKLNGLGNLEWQKCLGGSGNEYAYDVQQTNDGGFIIAGYSNSKDGDLQGNVGNVYNYWITKINSTGNLIWQKTLGGGSWDTAYSIEQTNDNGFIVAGESFSNDGDVTKNYGYYDFWIVKLSSENLSTSSFNKHNFTIYPNPTQSQINFSQEINTLEVFDIAGKKVKSFQNPSTTYDVASLQKGVYILKGTTTDGKSINEKLVKE
jgi:hypothetical protein